MVLIPAFLMVSTIRFRSVKAIDMGWRRSYLALFLAAVALALIASHPRVALVIMAYSYVAFAFVMWGVSKLGKRHGGDASSEDPAPPAREQQVSSPEQPLQGDGEVGRPL